MLLAHAYSPNDDKIGRIKETVKTLEAVREFLKIRGKQWHFHYAAMHMIFLPRGVFECY